MIPTLMRSWLLVIRCWGSTRACILAMSHTRPGMQPEKISQTVPLMLYPAGLAPQRNTHRRTAHSSAASYAHCRGMTVAPVLAVPCAAPIADLKGISQHVVHAWQLQHLLALSSPAVYAVEPMGI